MPLVDDSPLSEALPFEISVPFGAVSFWRRRMCNTWHYEFVFRWKSDIRGSQRPRSFDFAIPFEKLPSLADMRFRIAEQNASNYISCRPYNSPMRTLLKEIKRAVAEEEEEKP